VKINQKVQINFPCGYKVLAKRSMNIGMLAILINGGIPRTNLPVCPLHGKNCKKNISMEVK